eukprot:2741889-Amphidinium_carterae.1
MKTLAPVVSCGTVKLLHCAVDVRMPLQLADLRSWTFAQNVKGTKRSKLNNTKQATACTLEVGSQKWSGEGAALTMK